MTNPLTNFIKLIIFIYHDEFSDIEKPIIAIYILYTMYTPQHNQAEYVFMTYDINIMKQSISRLSRLDTNMIMKPNLRLID